MSKKERKRMCLNCRHRVIKDRSSYCELDDSYMHYSAIFEGWCKHWAKEPGLIPIDEVILVKEASLDVPYHEIKTILDFIKSRVEFRRINTPSEVTEILQKWEEFLVENL